MNNEGKEEAKVKPDLELPQWTEWGCDIFLSFAPWK